MAVVTTTFAPLLCCQPFYILLAPIDEQIQLKCTTKKKAEAQKNGLVNEDAGKRTEGLANCACVYVQQKTGASM